MAVAQKAPFITPEEYLREERAAVYKSEYYAGEVFAMAGASREHSLITARVIGELHRLLKASRCVPYDSNLRVHIPPTGLSTYPDVSVVCEPPEPAEPDGLMSNPTVIVEVLSDSTEAYDRGTKFAHYRTIPTLLEYVLVSQTEPLIDLFTRQLDATWKLTPVRGLDATARLASLGIELRLAEVYDRIEFPKLSLKPPHDPIR